MCSHEVDCLLSCCVDSDGVAADMVLKAAAATFSREIINFYQSIEVMFLSFNLLTCWSLVNLKRMLFSTREQKLDSVAINRLY